MRREITKEEYEGLLKFYDELKRIPKPKKIYDKNGNMYLLYEDPESDEK